MLIMQLLNTYITILCLVAFHLVYIILFCIRVRVVNSYEWHHASLLYFTYLAACICRSRSGLFNVELKTKIRERSERKNLWPDQS